MTSNSKLIILLFLVFGLSFGAGDKVMAACVGGVPDGFIDILGGEVCDSDTIACGFVGTKTCDGVCGAYIPNAGCFEVDPCNQDPTVVITPPAPSVAIETVVTYTVTVTNNDNGVCGSRDFSLTMTSIDLNLNYVTFFASNPLTLIGAGGNKSTTFDMASDALAGLGNYNFDVTATEGGNSGTDTGLYTVSSIYEICNNGVDTNGDGILDIGDDDGDGDIDCLDLNCLGHPSCCGNNTKEGIEFCDPSVPASCPAGQVCNSFCSGCMNPPANDIYCPAGFDDCDCDGICETNVLSDKNNCGTCGAVCGTICVNGSCALVTGGLVPCGRMSDNPDTVWNEREDCKICHLVILADSAMGYLLGIVGIITVLSLVVGGMLYVASSGNSSLVTTAKTAFRKSLYGFVIVFIAWVMTNTTMVLFGFDDPLGDGSWHKFDCDVSTVPPITYICGDGIVTSPNDNGILEICDPKELEATFVTRKIAVPGNCINGDGNCPPDCFTTIDSDCVKVTESAAWARAVYSCNFATCDFGCAADPNFSNIGGGCYQPNLAGGGLGDLCQKGRFVCDFSTDTVICHDTYNDLNYKLARYKCTDIYDYCCDSAGAPFVIDGAGPGGLTAGVDFTIERGFGTQCINFTTPAGAVINNCTGFNCDEVCKDAGGKICIGVGLMNSITNSCRYIQHDIAQNCDLPGNLATTDCRKTFGKRQPGIMECRDSTGAGFNVGEAACYCR